MVPIAGPVTALVHDRAQQRLFSASFDTSIRVWTTVVGDTAVYRTLRGQHGAPLVALALSDGSSARQKARLYSASSDGRVTTWDVGGRGALATVAPCSQSSPPPPPTTRESSPCLLLDVLFVGVRQTSARTQGACQFII